MRNWIRVNPTHCHLHYTNAGGEESKRELYVFSYSEMGNDYDLLFMGRDAERVKNFRLSRVHSIQSNRTGELLDEVPISVSAFITMLTLEPPPLTHNINLPDSLRPFITAFVFLARSDGRFHPLEVDVISQFCMRHSPDWAWSVNDMSGLLDSFNPTLHQFRKAIRHIDKLDDVTKLRFKRYAERLTIADEILCDEEFECGILIDEDLSQF